MRIAIAADHAGFQLKEDLRNYLEGEGYELIDAGAYDYEPTDDYPIYAAKAARMVSDGLVDRGILVCDSGIGVDIVANKIPHVRSALVHDEQLASTTRQHNDTNVLSMGSMFVDPDKAKRIAKTWLDTDFSHAERHERRIHEIEELEESAA